MAKEKYSILCIDDNKLVRQTFVNYLESLNYIVYDAENGKEGLKLFREHNLDLILLDLLMPEIGGQKVLEIIKSESEDSAVIVISGAGVMHDVIQALRLGACDYITKPIEDMGILKIAIEKCLERRNLIRENKELKKRLCEK